MSTMTQTAPNVMVHQMLGTNGGKDSGIVYSLLLSHIFLFLTKNQTLIYHIFN